MVEATDAASAVQFQIRAIGRFKNLGGGGGIGEQGGHFLEQGLPLFLTKSAVQSWCSILVFALVGQ